MKTSAGCNRTRAWLILLALLPAFSLAAEESASDSQDSRTAWRIDFQRALVAAAEGKGPPLSPIVLRIALAEGEASLSAIPAEDAALLCVGYALQAERSLRFGLSPQEARARLRQALAFSDQSGGGRLFARELDRRQRYGFAEQMRGGAAGRGHWTYQGGAAKR